MGDDYTVDLVLPKGSLEEPTFILFKEANLEVIRRDREYNPIIDDPRIGRVKILRPQEIPKYIELGYFDIGITGRDWVVESGADVIEVAELPYSKKTKNKVRIVIAVAEDSGINDVKDIKPGSRVTTEYPNITKRYFDNLNIPIQLFFSYGASEAKVPEIMDVVVDLVETGSTLERNRLKIIGEIMTSYTVLIANKNSIKDDSKREEIDDIKTLLLGVVEGRENVYLVMNVPDDKLNEIMNILPAMKKPTISQLYDSGYYSVQTVVSKREINVLIPKLKQSGAEDILELNINKIVR
ncbi:MAG: ATP phosphoribosyltransferase [Candidatus Methanoliparum thermophilum]|uniref:ATP phosphoribosyltransferase n=1 Tax=Methanoliparum thermophilum TaxID=2491083 RepID=A0A520KR22_METT2|nr:ATP phosphoribosyltransferase [Candidatus Methanoliparum sp. LAM-1]RZN64075.1 MAG: ATP phosphoribosyltransferase [Candidatus Methanoliparum thermophilum]